MNQMTQADFRSASPFKLRYDNFIGGTFVAPFAGCGPFLSCPAGKTPSPKRGRRM